MAAPKEKQKITVWMYPETCDNKIRKSGTGGIYELNDHLYEGRYTPTNANGKRESHNVYGKTREECQEKFDAMIVEVRARINAEKEAMRIATEIAN